MAALAMRDPDKLDYEITEIKAAIENGNIGFKEGKDTTPEDESELWIAGGHMSEVPLVPLLFAARDLFPYWKEIGQPYSVYHPGHRSIKDFELYLDYSRICVKRPCPDADDSRIFDAHTLLQFEEEDPRQLYLSGGTLIEKYDGTDPDAVWPTICYAEIGASEFHVLVKFLAEQFIILDEDARLILGGETYREIRPTF